MAAYIVNTRRGGPSAAREARPLELISEMIAADIGG
jgi:hypothetical protein